MMKFVCSPKLCKICEKINKENGLRKITGPIRIYCEDLWFKAESKCCNLPAEQSAAWNINQWANYQSPTFQYQPAGLNFNQWATSKTATIASKSARTEILKRLRSNGVKQGHNEKDFMGAIIIIIALILFCFVALLTFSLMLKIRKIILKRFTKQTKFENKVLLCQGICDGICQGVCVTKSTILKRKSIFELN